MRRDRVEEGRLVMRWGGVPSLRRIEVSIVGKGTQCWETRRIVCVMHSLSYNSRRCPHIVF